MTARELLSEIDRRLRGVHGVRLRGTILYGSEARGEARPHSDIDVLVLLDEPIRLLDDLDTNLKALRPLSEKLGRRISAKPVSWEQFHTVDCPLYRSARKEGIAL